MIKLSKNEISTYVGDVLPIELIGDGIDWESDISWFADGEVARVRSFPDGDRCAKNAALVSVWGEGVGYVSAEYLGKKYTAGVCAKAITSSADEGNGGYKYFLADTHAHTTTIHDCETFKLHETEDIPDYVEATQRDGGLDLTVISDHACVTNDRDFYRGFKCAEDADAPIIFAGAESEVVFVERDRFGIEHRHSGELVTVMSAGYKVSYNWDEFEAEMTYSKAPIGIFAHPLIVGYSTKGVWNFDFAKRGSKIMKHLMRGFEMGSGTEKKDNILHEYAYSQALDAGFKLSATCAGDCHGPDWGFGYCPGKTVILASEKSKEAFHDAFRKCRFYATESGNVKLRYSVNGCYAPTELKETDTYRFKLELDLFEPDASTMPTLCHVITDYGVTAYECRISGKVTEFEIKSDSARYFYLRLIDEVGRKIWSMPVWCGRDFDTPSEPKLTPIDMSDFVATADGVIAPELIDGKPLNSFFAKSITPKIVIDMKEKRKVSALGYYPHQVFRSEDKGPDWNTFDETPSLIAKYNIYTSEDGADFKLIKTVVCQVLGEENIVTFEPHEARFVMMEVTATVGMNSYREVYRERCARIGNLSLFE